MQGYRPDWVDFIVIVVLFLVALAVTSRLGYQVSNRKMVNVLAIVVAAILSVIVRTILRHFDI